MTKSLELLHANPSFGSSLYRIRSLVLDSVTSPQSKRSYGSSIDKFLLWHQSTCHGSGFTKAAVQAYKSHLLGLGLASSSVNLQLSAIRALAREAGDNGLMDAHLAGGISRVKGVRREGIRTGNWLTKDQAEELINKPDVATLKGKRDRAMLALMIGSGLRRDEVAMLHWSSIQQREGRWVIVDMVGKGRKVRSVPIPSFAKAALDVWYANVLTEGGIPASEIRVFQSINKGDRISSMTMTAQSIFETVKHYAALIGLPNLAPHDLRRTFAKLAHSGRAALEQIQLSLGHSSIQTTERYLGVRQDLTDAPCDHLGLKI